MKWIDRIFNSLRTAARDLISEDDQPADANADRATALLDAAGARLNVLRDELAQAIAREKRLEIDWHAAQTQADALNEAIDALLRASDDDAARIQIEPASRAQVKADELNERYQAAVRVTARLRDQVRSLQTQVDEARQQQENIGLRESGAESLEKLHQLQREQHKDARALNEDLTTRRETVARREDRLAARDDIDRTA
jgi:phage shock protein A